MDKYSDTTLITDNCDISTDLGKNLVHENHILNHEQYDKEGHFIVGSGVTCPNCGTEWEDYLGVLTCPCMDDSYML